MVAKILIVYGTTEGHTAAIAQRMASAMQAGGHEVDVRDSSEVRKSTIDEPYDGVLVGGSVHRGDHQTSVRDFVRGNLVLLERVPSAFFSVSLAAVDSDGDAQAEMQATMDKFARESGWQPSRVEPIAGALVYSQYNFFMRHVMKMISKQHGQPTDTSQDYDFTDWDAVEAFARDFAAGVASGTPVAAGS